MALLTETDLSPMRGVLDELSNARLLKIFGPGAADAYGDQGQGAELWTGSVPAWLTRERSDRSGEVEETVERDVLRVLERPDVPALASIVAAPDQQASRILVEDRRVTPAVQVIFQVAAARYEAFDTLDSFTFEIRVP